MTRCDLCFGETGGKCQKAFQYRMQAGRREKLLASIKSKDTKVVRVELPKCRLEDEMFISDIITLAAPSEHCDKTEWEKDPRWAVCSSRKR